MVEGFKRRTPSRRGEGGALRAEILAAAARLLAQSGREGDLSLRAVAREAGISAPSIYLHFEDRAALVAAVTQQAYERLVEELRAARQDASAGGPQAALRAMAHRYCGFAFDNPQQYRLMFGIERVQVARQEKPWHPVFLLFDAWTEAVAGCRDGRPDGPRDALVGRLLWSSLHGVVAMAMVLPYAADSRRIEDLTDDLLDLVMPG